MADAPRFEGAAIVSAATDKTLMQSGKNPAFHLLNWTV
jgi:hypothetical protein